LPDSLEQLILCGSYENPLYQKFPKSLKILRLADDFNHPFVGSQFSSSLKVIIFGRAYDKKLPEDLPDSIEIIELHDTYKIVLPEKLPKSLKKISMRKKDQRWVLGMRYQIQNDLLYKNGVCLNVRIN